MSQGEQERRKHKRINLTCPMSLLADDGSRAADGKVRNISDGGVLAALPRKPLPAEGSLVDVNMRLPRSTDNTYMLEEVSCRAKVVRHVPGDASTASLALEFTTPLDLALEV